MESGKDLNGKLKEEVNKRFEELFRKIGNNRQQLSQKVMGVQLELIKELNKEKVDQKRQEEILREVSATEKMAAKQLPHLNQLMLKLNVPKPAAPAVEKKNPTPATEKAPVAKEKKVAKPAIKKAAAPAKTAAAKKKK